MSVAMIVIATTRRNVSTASQTTLLSTATAIASGLKWVLGLSLVFEAWVSIFVRAPILPGFVVEKADDPIEYWSRSLGIVSSRKYRQVVA